MNCRAEHLLNQTLSFFQQCYHNGHTSKEDFSNHHPHPLTEELQGH